MGFKSKIYNIYYKMGQCYVTSLSFFLFKNREVFFLNFYQLFKRKAEILTTLNQGTKFWIRSFNDIQIIRQIFGEGVYKTLFDDLKEDSTFIDIGAYIGDSAIYASGFNKIKNVIALEPVPDNLKFLRKNLAENNIKKVQVIDKALTVDSKGRTMYIFTNETIASTIYSSNSIGKIFVKTITLDNLLKNVKTKSILLKCDIEVGEYELFLQCSLKLLSRIDRLVIELHVFNDKHKKLFKELLNHLEKAGFKYKVKRSFFNPKYPILFGHREILK